MVERNQAERDLELREKLAPDLGARPVRRQGPAQQIADFAQPLIDGSNGDYPSVQKAMSLGMLFWNLALCKEGERREEMLADVMANTMKLDQREQEDFRALAESMVERHRQMFPEMHHGVRALILSQNGISSSHGK